MDKNFETLLKMQEKTSDVVYGVCRGRNSSTEYIIQLDGDSKESKKYYTYLGASTLANGQRVILLKSAGTYVILGELKGRSY
ncbi:hypothetical protein 10S12_8 [uncultured Caudovirales phage]|uniref:Uncharacterized protein n=1 Tax=uncultured Caudovirales phage TaxID=2100421 RepID=A0A2H4JAJ8_9CAUD|nr:hypothetical protein 10S12_8 [uncultured Caudovirales phage]